MGKAGLMGLVGLSLVTIGYAANAGDVFYTLAILLLGGGILGYAVNGLYA